jgi:type I restriction enzyme, S subunit
LFFWFLSPTIVKKINATWTGARMPRANMNEVIKFKIRIPSISIQKQITKDLDALMFYTFDIELKYNRKLQYLEELKKSILQKAFTGELTAKEITV